MPSYTYQGIPILMIKQNREMYDTYPACQREHVWKKPMEKRLIDSILRGLPIPPISMIDLADDFFMGKRFGVVDGQQRIKAILNFIDGKFRTANAQKEIDEPKLHLIEPGRLYQELSEATRQRFDTYNLQVCYLDSKQIPDGNIGLVYRRLNYQVKLTFAEKLYSYSSETKDLAMMLNAHPFWSLYGGKRDRKQVFQMGVNIILFETMGCFANITHPRLRDFAHGDARVSMNKDFENRIRIRLDGLRNIFDGIVFKGMYEFTPIYQAGMLLEEMGCDLIKSERGCLGEWYTKIYSEQSGRLIPGDIRSNILLELQKVGSQIDFWNGHLEELKGCIGLVYRDKRRSFNDSEKMAAWIRQKGKCPKCGQKVTISEVGHHLIPYSSGGKTKENNCVLVHDGCSKKIHAEGASIPFIFGESGDA